MTLRRALGPINRATELANWIMMGGGQSGKSTLVLEGESDTNAYLSFLSDSTRVLTARGKDVVLDAMGIVRSAGYQGAFAIVDADFDHLQTGGPTFEDVARTDTHDIETMMISTDAFHKALLRYGYGRKGGTQIDVSDFQARAVDLLKRLQGAAGQIGYLRWASKQHGLNIRFKEVELFKVVDHSTLVVREDRLEAEVLRRSDASAGSWPEIKAKAGTLVARNPDPWQICNGHDLTCLLALHLSRVLSVNLTQKTVEADLALAYSIDDFRKTALCEHLRKWETKNTPRRIFR